MPTTQDGAMRQHEFQQFAAEAIDSVRDEISNALERLNNSHDTASPGEMVSLITKYPARPFLTALDTRLKAAKEKVQSRTACEDSSRDLLVSLEQLVNWPQKFRPKRNAIDPSSYPQLHMITRERSSEKHQRAKSAAQAAIMRLSTSGRAGLDRKGIQNSLKKFAPIRTLPRASEANQILRSSGTEPAVQNTVVECLRELHTTLCDLACCPKGTFQANVSLSFTPDTPISDEEVVLEVLISHNHKKNENIHVRSSCREAHIHAYQGSGIKLKETGDQVDKLCELIHDQDTARLKLRVFRRSLFRSVPERRIPPMIDLQLPSVPLTDLIPTASMRTHEQRRLLLSFLLAKAVWRFYDVDWMTEDWTREAVHFMRQTAPAHSSLSHKPFIVTELRHSTHKPNVSNRTHRLPRILALGIVLLEIEVGRAIVPTVPGNVGDYTWANMAHTAAGNFLQSKEWLARRQTKTPEPLAKAIEICVNPGPELKGTDNVRSSLYTAVVQRLSRLFSAMWLPEGGRLEAFKLDPIDFFESTASRPNNDDFDQINEQKVNREASSSSKLSRPVKPSPEQTSICHEGLTDCGGLFATENNRTISVDLCNESQEWILAFKRLRKRFNLGRESSRIKLAILDTGAECDHPDLRDERVIECKSFINEDDSAARRDFSGHGTHITGIILNLTTNVDIYIAKITNYHVLRDRQSVVQALRWAREEWKVDMISMSFGYHRMSGKDTVKKEVDECLKEDIVLFASASNDGANAPRTYPGKYEGVLCIHSATGLGNPSSFNPTAETRMKNFCVLGDGIESSWPEREGGTGRKQMSGTSFATPVAVSIAAFMISYLRHTLPDIEWDTKPMSPSGVKAIFEEMSMYNHRMDYDIVSPMHFFQGRETEWLRQRFMEVLHGYPSHVG